MLKIINSLYNLRLLDEFARKQTFIHKIHPIAKLITTAVYLSVVTSFGKHEIVALIPFIFYPALIFTLGEIPIKPILKKILIIEPFIIGIGILNPILDNEIVNFYGIVVSKGWIAFISIIIKSFLTITAALLLAATTGIDSLAGALQMLKVPRLFIMQLMLMYRYITLLMEEVGRVIKAYSIRASGHKGIHFSAWGSLVGLLLIRTFERAERIYHTMELRGFTGEYNIGSYGKLNINDLAYIIGWTSFFVAAKIYNIPVLIGLLMTGVI